MAVQWEFESAAMSAAEFERQVFIPLCAVSKSLLEERLTVAQFVRVLIEHEIYQDAANWMAHALPTRRAIWWGCLALAQSVDMKKLPEYEQYALVASGRWVAEPNEKNRVIAEDAAALVLAQVLIFG